MLNYKLQVGCLIIVLYIAFLYRHECKKLKKKHKLKVFDALLAVGILYYFFDIVTVYTVNHLETVNDTFNRVCHAGFLVSVDVTIFLLFYYMLAITDCIPKERKKARILLWVPLCVNIAVVLVYIGQLEFIHGKITNYSMGMSAYTCYIMAAVYMILTILIVFRRWSYIEGSKRASIVAFLIVLVGVTSYQMIIPESLVSSLAVAMNILGIYVNMENPAKMELDRYHKEMVYGFANMIEGRDGSTGQHVKRTTRYVDLIASELRKKGYYSSVLTKDYRTNLLQAAPLHDVGKISTPDAILQKPGKLTNEEYDIMKLHTINGAKLIQNCMRNLGEAQYINLAYQVALYHHEKWNGNGYPEGLSETQIPLCARIMAVADVFDALVEKRCYKEKMTLEQGFEIIHSEAGNSFDPVIVKVFLEAKEQVKEIHDSFFE